MDEITAQVIVFFTGGFETTSATISFCLYELAMNMDIQTRLATEIDTILEKYGGSITYEAVKDMKYLGKIVSGEIQEFQLANTNLLEC
jgi:cytochrome P450 family 6